MVLPDCFYSAVSLHAAQIPPGTGKAEAYGFGNHLCGGIGGEDQKTGDPVPAGAAAQGRTGGVGIMEQGVDLLWRAAVV